MRISSVVLVLLLLAISIPGCNNATPTVRGDASKYASLKGDATKGKDKFIGSCSTCHGHEARGLPGLGKDLTSSAFAKNLSDAELILFVTRGRAVSDPANTSKVDMPPKGGNPVLGDQDIADIVAYQRTLQK
jgi:disulfide bond formation protein DsbB